MGGDLSCSCLLPSCGSGLGVACRESPGGESLFFASPKKSNQKKGDPQSGPLCGSSPARTGGGNGFGCGCGGSPHPSPLPEGEGVKPGLQSEAFLDSLSLWERVRVRASPNPHLPPHPVDVRRLRSRQVSRFSVSANFFKEPQSGPDCGSPFLLLTLLTLLLAIAKRKVSCCRATPGLYARQSKDPVKCSQ